MSAPDFSALGAKKDDGSVAVARLLMANQPADTNTIGIGADTYEFVDEAVNTVVANDANIAVSIGGNAAATRANLIAAINATDANNQHATITKADAVTPAIANGTAAVVADEIGTTIRIRSATAAGGSALSADPSVALAESITDAADIWDVGNVNLNTLAGKAGTLNQNGRTSLTITTAMITAGGVRIDFPFTVNGFIATCESATGAQKTSGADTIAIANSGLLITLNGGGGDLANTDVVKVIVW